MPFLRLSTTIGEKFNIVQLNIIIITTNYVYRYQKNAKIASRRFKDRPMSPSESVVYWTEYVLRHKGASHLKYHALNLTWYQYLLVDVICTFLFIVFVVSSIIYYGLKMIWKHVSKFFYNVKSKRE